MMAQVIELQILKNPAVQFHNTLFPLVYLKLENTQRLQKLIYQHFLTDCSMKISLQSLEQIKI